MVPKFGENVSPLRECQENSNCPRCDQENEDSKHVVICLLEESAELMWKAEHNHLTQWMSKQQTNVVPITSSCSVQTVGMEVGSTHPCAHVLENTDCKEEWPNRTVNIGHFSAPGVGPHLS